MSSTLGARGREDWVDRTQAAALANKHPDTIRRAETRHQLTTRIGSNGSVLLNVGELVETGVIPASVLAPEVSAKDVANAHQVRAELENLRREHAALQGRYDAHQETIELLQSVIAGLKAHIADLRAMAGVDR